MTLVPSVAAILNPKTIIAMIHSGRNEKLTITAPSHFQRDRGTAQIRTVVRDKTFSIGSIKRVLMADFESLPYGYYQNNTS